jgi:hypothetical protein
MWYRLLRNCSARDPESRPPDGPHGEFTEEQLRIAWEVERDHLRGGLANRPWAYWKFELGEEPPRDSDLKFPWPEAIRLAELGDLRPDNWPRCGNALTRRRPELIKAGTTSASRRWEPTLSVSRTVRT